MHSIRKSDAGDSQASAKPVLIHCSLKPHHTAAKRQGSLPIFLASSWTEPVKVPHEAGGGASH